MEEVNFKKIESKWQKAWELKKIFEVKKNSKEEKYYVLVMFPYPSGNGLHMGHALNYVIGDILARYKKMQGFNVLHPMGYDALGLPAENAAIKAGTRPQEYTNNAIKNYIKQQKELGISYDWSRMVNTADPNYYKWDQWIFLKMLEKNLAHQKESDVNWCPKCDTVLANEQVQNGKCWRHEDTEVEIKNLKQWYFKITDYADELYTSIDKLDGWPEKTKAMQKNWIGKSHGVDIYFKLENSDKVLPTFTTRCDTTYSVTFLAVAPESPLIPELVAGTEYEKPAKDFIEKVKKQTLIDRANQEKEKQGVFTGKYAINPLNNEKIPIYISNFVLMYGSGVVMCDAHDKRDFRFARKYKIPLKFVISKDGKKIDPKDFDDAFTDDGILFNSGEFSGMDNRKALPKMADYIEKKGFGKKIINFRLKDWGISRQRYWGTPIPIIHCKECGAVPVPEKDLPVELPKQVKFGKGNPLETNKEWVNVKCPKCGGEGKRETDTMDTFVNSSWYFLRYCDPNNDKKIFDKDKVEAWCPIDQYIGGAEHACMHLIYFRFYTKFLADLGLINFREPAKKLFHQGMLHGEGGNKMSKSKGNVVNPDAVSEKYGIDTARYFLLSLAEPDKPREWSEKGIQGSLRFTKKLILNIPKINLTKTSTKLSELLNKTIKQVGEDIEEFRYRIATIKIKQLFDQIIEEKQTAKKDLESAIKLLSPFCPHIAEELWAQIGNNKSGNKFISLEKWPEYKKEEINKNSKKPRQILENLTKEIIHIKEILEKRENKKLTKAFIYVIPSEKESYLKEIKNLEKAIQLKINIYGVNEKTKHDPEGKAKKAKPGKPAIYLK